MAKMTRLKEDKARYAAFLHGLQQLG